MKKSLIIYIASGSAIFFLTAASVLSSGGIANYSGSPVDGGPTTTGQCSGCHSGGTTTPTLAVAFSPALTGVNQYVPNQTYTVTLTPSGSYSGYGMNLEIVNSTSSSTSSVSMFGTFVAAVSTNCQIFALSNTTPYPPCISHNQRSSSPFKFSWKAPASGTGYLYANVLGANGDGSTSGDKVSGVYSATLTPASTTGIANQNNAVASLSVYPNPVKDNLNVSYSLSETGKVSIRIYSLNGELVSELLNEDQDPGVKNNHISLPSNIESGVYLIKVVLNDKVSTQKIVVL